MGAEICLQYGRELFTMWPYFEMGFSHKNRVIWSDLSFLGG